MSSIKCVSLCHLIICLFYVSSWLLNVYLNVFIFQKYYCMPDLNFFIKLFLNVFLLANNYTVILVFKFFIVIKLHAVRGCLAGV